MTANSADPVEIRGLVFGISSKQCPIYMYRLPHIAYDVIFL